MTLAFAAVAALVFLSWLTDRVALLVPALVDVARVRIRVVAVGPRRGRRRLVVDDRARRLGSPVRGLALDRRGDVAASWTTELADWVHLSAASLWIGGLVSLLVAVWPAAPELRRQAFTSFSRLATILIGLVLAAGTYLSVVRLPHLHDLWTTGYGHVLLVKISLVAVALTWGAAHHFLVRPRLAGAGDVFFARVGRSMVGESAVGIAVLLAAAVLTDSKPPPQPVPASVTQAAVHR